MPGHAGPGIAGANQQASLSRGSGVMVEEVLEGGPAGSAGIEVDDHIINFAGESIDNASELRYLTALTKPGTEIEIQTIMHFSPCMTLQ